MRIATPEDIAVGIDNSQIKMWLECRRKYHYVYRLGLAGNTVGPAAHFSSWLVHKPLALFYETAGAQTPDWQALWDGYCKATDLQAAGNALYTATTTRRIYDEYTTRHHSDLSMYDLFCVETTLARELPGVQAPFLSKPDVVLRNKDDGSLLPVDFKCGQRIGPVLQFDRQQLGQVYVCDGAADSFMRVAIHLSYKNPPRIERDTVFVPTWRLDEWRHEMSRIVSSMVAVGNAEKAGDWQCSNCGFLQLCLASPGHEQLLGTWPKRDNRAYLLKE